MQFPHMKLPKVLCGPKAHDDAATAKTTATASNNEDETSLSAVSAPSDAMAQASITSAPVTTPLPNEETAGILTLLMDELPKDDPHAVGTALHKLADYCHNGKTKNAVDNQNIIFTNGGHLAIVQAMKKFVDKAEVQVYGLGAVMNLTSRSEEHKMLLAQIGGIEMIVKSMDAHIGDAVIQRRGCGSLANILQDSEANGIRLDQGHGITSIVAAMNAFPDDARVQFYGLRTFSSLTHWEECEAHILGARGASTVSAALENHGDDAEVIKEARKLMGHFATSKVIAKKSSIDI